MMTQQNKPTNNRQFECNSLELEIASNNKLIRILKLQRAETIQKMNDIVEGYDYETLNTIATNIQQIENDNAVLEANSRKLGCHHQTTAPVSYDNQTVISTSSVRRKDAMALERKDPYRDHYC